MLVNATRLTALSKTAILMEFRLFVAARFRKMICRANMTEIDLEGKDSSDFNHAQRDTQK